MSEDGEWEVEELGTLCELYQPKTISKKNMKPNGRYPVFGANGQIGFYDEFNHEEPQLLVTCRGATCGAVNVSPPKAWINGNAMVVRPRDERIDRRFLEYMFRGAIDIDEVITGAAQPQITRTNLAPLKIRFPQCEAEQKRIVSILDEAFSAIAKAKENAEKNLANARELFESYLNRVFTQQGPGWQEKTLPDISENLDRQRKPITKSKREPGKIPYYGASGVVDHVKDFLFDEDLLLISEDGANLLARTYPIAFSASGKTWVNNHAHVLRFDSITTQRFIEFYLNSISLEPWVSGMAQPKLNQTNLNTIPVPVAPADEQSRFVKTLESLQAESKRLETIYTQKLANLDELKQSLLQKAFTGQLTAREEVAV